MTALFIPFLLFNMERKSGEALWILRPFSFTTGLFLTGYNSFSTGVKGTTSLYLNLVGISKKNRTLTTENAKLKAKLIEMTELTLENERLRNLLKFKQKSEMKLMAGKVIGKDLVPEHNTVTINIGTRHGIKKNMAVITAAGAVGYVLSPEVFTSQIILLTDPYAAIDALVQRSRARGIVEGHNSDKANLNYLKRGDDAVIGDLVITSGLDNIFPKGFPVGVISNVKKSRFGTTQDIELSPVINPNNLEEVFVILDAKLRDFEPQPVGSPEEIKNKTSPKGDL